MRLLSYAHVTNRKRGDTNFFLQNRIRGKKETKEMPEERYTNKDDCLRWRRSGCDGLGFSLSSLFRFEEASSFLRVSNRRVFCFFRQEVRNEGNERKHHKVNF